MNQFGKPLPMQIAERIATKIIEGAIEPGSRIFEEQLAEEFGTSRAPIREALYILTLQGLIERTPRKGAIVKSYTRQDIEQLYQVRSHLEQLALSQIPFPLSGPGELRFTLILEDMERAVKARDYHLYSELNIRFHRTLFELADNNILSKLYEQLEIPLHFLLKLSVRDEDTLLHSFEEHKLMISLILSKQRDEALAVLKQHDSDSLSRVSDYFHNSKK